MDSIKNAVSLLMNERTTLNNRVRCIDAATAVAAKLTLSCDQHSAVEQAAVVAHAFCCEKIAIAIHVHCVLRSYQPNPASERTASGCSLNFTLCPTARSPRAPCSASRTLRR